MHQEKKLSHINQIFFSSFINDNRNKIYIKCRSKPNKNVIHCSLETPKRVNGKRCRPRSDAVELGKSSESPLFAKSLAIFL